MSKKLKGKLARAMVNAFGNDYPNLCEAREFAASLSQTLQHGGINSATNDYPDEGMVGVFGAVEDNDFSIMFHTGASPTPGRVIFDSVAPHICRALTWAQRDTLLIQTLATWITESAAEKPIRTLYPGRRPVELSEAAANVILTYAKAWPKRPAEPPAPPQLAPAQR